MATSVIDALIVTLGLDPTNFKKGQKEAAESLVKTKQVAEKSGKEMEAVNKKTAESFKKVKDELLSLTAVLLGGYGIKAFIADVTKSDAAVGRLSKNLGVSASELGAWEGVAKKFGSSASDIDASFRSLNEVMQETWLHGAPPPEVSEALARMGIDFNKFFDKSTALPEKMKMLQKQFAGMSREDAQYWGQRLKLSEDTVNMLLRTSGSIDDVIAEQKRQNDITEAQTKKAEELEEQWESSMQTVKGLAREIWYDLLPAVLEVLHALENFVTFAKGHVPAVKAVVAGLGLAFGALAALQFQGLIAGLTGVEVAAGGALATILPIVAGVAALAGAVWLLSKGVNAVAGGGHKRGEVNPETGDVWEPGVNGRGGKWVNKGGSPTKRWASTGRGGHWVDVAPGPSRAASGKIAGLSDLQAMADAAADAHGIPREVFRALVGHESNWDVAADANKNFPNSHAYGLTQLQPGTARGLHVDPRDPQQNLNGGATYLQQQLAQFGNVRDALGHYHAGPGAKLGSADYAYADQILAASRNLRMASQPAGAPGSSSSSSVTINGDVNVNAPNATDAPGIAMDMGAAIKNVAFAGQANQGPR